MSFAVTDGANSYTFTEEMRSGDYVVYRNLTDPANSEAPFDRIEQRKFSALIQRPKGGAAANPDGTYRSTKVTFAFEVPVLKEAAAGAGNSAGYIPPKSVDHRVLAQVKLTLPANADDDKINHMIDLVGNFLITLPAQQVAQRRSLTPLA